MMEKLKALAQKHSGLLWYLVIGGLTTVVDIAVFWLTHTVLGWHYQIAKIIAWVAAVAVAFGGNRTLVFRSEATGTRAILLEAARFVGTRILTLLFSLAFMFVAVEWIGLDENLANILSLIGVVILNYVLGRLLVFRKGKGEQKENIEK